MALAPHRYFLIRQPVPNPTEILDYRLMDHQNLYSTSTATQCNPLAYSYYLVLAPLLLVGLVPDTYLTATAGDPLPNRSCKP